MDQAEKIFAEGFIFKRNEKAPDFVVGRISMKVDEAVAFINKHQKNGWINLGVKQARSGNYYVELDTFEAGTKESAVDKYQAKQQPKQQPTEEEEEELF